MRGFLLALLSLVAPTLLAQQTYNYDEYKVISIAHQPGDVIQVFKLICKDGQILIDTTDVDLNKFPEDSPVLTYWTAPPGQYQMNHNGLLTIVNIKGDTPDKPDPPDPPDPPETVEETVAELTKDQTQNDELAKVFDKHAKVFWRTEGNTAELFQDWTLDMQATIGAGNDYGGLRTYMNDYIQEEWPMSNREVSAFFSEVAKGLGL